MLQKKKWLPIAWIIFLLQIGLEAYAAYSIVKLDVLPNQYLLIVVVALALMLMVTAVLFFLGTGHGPSRSRRIRRIVAIILAVLMGLGSVAVASVTTRVRRTVDTVTTTTGTLQAMVGVYVMANDRASDISDTAGYVFGVMQNYDQANTKSAVQRLEEQLGTSIQTVSRPSMTENAEALYNGSVDAVIMNEAYAASLMNFEEYESFDTETKLLWEIPIEKNTDEGAAIDATEINIDTDSDISESPFIVYLSGSDTRSEILTTSRSDVNILMVVNPSTKQILLLNTPRDYYVENPAGGYALDKLTHCGIYGIDVSMEALANLYDTEVNYYAQINFTGFETLVDAIGGVVVDSPVAFTETHPVGSEAYSYVVGKNEMNGAQALGYARERYAFAEGDNMRGQNQMRVIRAVVDKISSASSSVLLNYSEVLDSLEGMFVTDLTSEDLTALVKMQIEDGTSWNIKSFAVTGQGGKETTYSAPNSYAYVMYQDEELVSHASDLIDKVLEGKTLTDSDVA